MTFARLHEPGEEISVLQRDGVSYDLRPLAADFDGAAALHVEAPIARPSKIACIGLNYRDHAEETGAALLGEPVVFIEDPAAMVRPIDEVLIPRRSAKTDGRLHQDDTTASRIFDIRHLVWFLSHFMVLHHGDVTNTGTAAGVALGQQDTPYLRAGDVVEPEIDGLGRARQTLVPA